MSAFTQSDIQTKDGFTITTRSFAPTESPKGAVLIVPAMGVAQNFYKAFAAWLRDQGYLVVTFDFRGIGLSRSESLRGFEADIFTWAEQDCGAVLDSIINENPELPIFWVGHSLGGQILPLVPKWNHVAKMVTVATGSGYWRENAPSLKRISWWLWYVAVPATLPLFGYFPGKRLRKVGDLPKGVMAQWRRWCLNREYLVGVEGESFRQLFSTVDKPITSFSFEDDQYMSKRNTESIHGFYTASDLKLKRFSKQEMDGQTVGHFGFFRSKFKKSLWPNLLSELTV